MSVLQVKQQIQKQTTGIVTINKAKRVSTLKEIEIAPTIYINLNLQNFYFNFTIKKIVPGPKTEENNITN